MKITSASEDRHAGIWNTSKALIKSDDSTEPLISVGDEYFQIEWMQLYRMVYATSGSTRQAIEMGTSGELTSAPIYVRHCLFLRESGGSGSGETSALRLSDSDPAYYINNNIFIGFNSSGGNDKAIQIPYSAGPSIFNNTFIDCTLGIRGDQNASVKNNVFQDCATDVTELDADSTNDYNLTDLTDVASGFSAQNNVFESTLTFVNAAGKDYHLASTDTDAIDAGVDLGTTGGVNIDIDNRDRDALNDTWDIGADEYVAAGGTETYSGRGIGRGISRGVFR